MLRCFLQSSSMCHIKGYWNGGGDGVGLGLGGLARGEREIVIMKLQPLQMMGLLQVAIFG